MPKSLKNTRPDNRKQKGSGTYVKPGSRYSTAKKTTSTGKIAQEYRESAAKKDRAVARKINEVRSRRK